MGLTCHDVAVIEDFENCYRFMQSRDPRYDGFFIVGVHTTGIYCRPSCPARLPKRRSIRLYSTSAAAQDAGLRACKRCNPDAAPSSPAWNLRADYAGRAMRLIAEGVMDREGVAGVADRLGFSERHLHRILVSELGAGPVALARAQRAQTARTLIEATALSFTEVAHAAGFGSVRQFNDTVRSVYDRSPTELRGRATRRGGHPTPGSIELKLAVRQPFNGNGLMDFLGDRTITEIESYDGTTYTRSLALAGGDAILALTAAKTHVRCVLRLDDLGDLASAVTRTRNLLDLDADPEAIDELLASDRLLRPLVQAAPGTRVARSVDGFEMVVRAIVGQQVSVAGARTTIRKLVQQYGRPLQSPCGDVTHVFPTAAAIGAGDPATFGMPRARGAALQAVAQLVASGELDLGAGADVAQAAQQMLAIKGIGPWTVSYVSMRALRDPDAFMPTDLGVKRGLESRGAAGDPKSAAALAENWRPWRSYANILLWSE